MLLGDVLGLGSVEVLEVWLQEDSVRHNMSIEGGHGVNHALHFRVVEFLFKSQIRDGERGLELTADDLAF